MGHGKETPRQKMIGMMYLVLTAMLALNVSADILNAFVLVDNGLVKTTANFQAKNESAYAIFEVEMGKSEAKVKPFRDKAFSVKDMADELALHLQDLKVEIVKYCDGDDAPSLSPVDWFIGEKGEKKSTYNIDDVLIKSKDNLDKGGEIMVVKGKGKVLKEKIEAFREHLLSMTDDPSVHKAIKESLNTDQMSTKDGTKIEWESGCFEHIPMIAVITMLSKLQSDVRNAEADIIQNLLAQIGATDTKVNKMEAIVQAKTSYVLKGNEYQARIILAAYDSLQKPRILLGPYRNLGGGNYEMVGAGTELPYDARGKAIYKSSPGVGNYKLEGLLQMLTPEGYKNFPFLAEYQVGESQTVISALKMNVLYIGVDNPISISVSGAPSNAIQASMTNGTITKNGNEWIARPTSPGTAVIRGSATIEGKSIGGDMTYRVKTVPDPVAKVGGKTSGKIAKDVLAAQTFLVAEMVNFDFDLRFEVTKFTVSVTRGGFAESKIANNNRITEEQKALIRGATKGGKVIFEEIFVKGPDGKTRQLEQSVVITVD